MNEGKIDTSDITEITDFSKARKNPYAERIKKYGYTITIHYSPEYIAKMTKRSLKKTKDFDMLQLDPDEKKALKKYEKTHKK